MADIRTFIELGWRMSFSESLGEQLRDHPADWMKYIILTITIRILGKNTGGNTYMHVQQHKIDIC